MNNGVRKGFILLLFFCFALLPSRVTRAPRLPRACLRLPEKRKKVTPVLQATIGQSNYLGLVVRHSIGNRFIRVISKL